MLIYWFIFCWTVAFGIMANMTSKEVCVGDNQFERRANLFFVIISFSVIILFVGLRSEVADTGAYIKGFKNYPVSFNECKELIFNESERAPGFVFFTSIIKCFISEDYHIWLFIISLITGICIMRPLYKYSCNFAMSIFLFIGSCQFTWMLNGMRQFLVAAIMFACTGFILKKKTIPYIISVLILSTVHTSALIFIPMYFIAKDEPWSKKNILFIMIIILAIIFTNQFTTILDGLVENTNYESSMEEFKNTDDGTSLLRIAVESVPIIIAFIYRNRIKAKLTPIIKISINMSLIASGLYIISRIARSGIMLGRLPIYFSLYNLILLPWLIDNIFEKNERRIINYVMIICYLGFFYYQMVMSWGGLGYISDILNLYY